MIFLPVSDNAGGFELSLRITNFSPVDAPVPVNCDPSPRYDVAVITPTALIPPARTFIPVRNVPIPSASTFVTSS